VERGMRNDAKGMVEEEREDGVEVKGIKRER
jgi:hypothetical protein